MKKAIISTMLLGFVLFSGIIVLVATISDDIVTSNKIKSLKTITDNTALAMAKHYVLNEDVDAAEEVAINLISQSKLGEEVANSLVVNWDFDSVPNTVTVTIDNYVQNTFWYRFLGTNSFNISGLESQAQIIEVDPLSEKTDTLAPIAINSCGRDETDFEVGSTLNFSFTTAPFYDDEDLTSFYGIDKDCTYPTGNSNFAHFKNQFSGGEVNYTDYDMQTAVDSCLVETSFENPLLVDPQQLYNELKHFGANYKMDVIVLGCGSDRTGVGQYNLVVENILSITLDANSLATIGTGSDQESLLSINTTVVPSDEVVILNY